jgi:hypothetical protein
MKGFNSTVLLLLTKIFSKSRRPELRYHTDGYCCQSSRYEVAQKKVTEVIIDVIRFG